MSRRSNEVQPSAGHPSNREISRITPKWSAGIARVKINQNRKISIVRESRIIKKNYGPGSTLQEISTAGSIESVIAIFVD